MTPKQFVKRLASVESVNCFNPYSDICTEHDLRYAYKIRRDFLQKLLEEAVKVEIDAFWIGRDLGYRGGRRTGLALTDEINASAYAKRWGLEFCRSTKGEACKERTASVIWDVLSQVQQPVFLWNVFPLHPYEVAHPFSNRAHNASERKIGEEVLSALVAMLKPHRLIAVGNDAVSSIAKVKCEEHCFKVRHPSYGGHIDFVEQTCALYSLDVLGKQSELF